MKKSLLSFLILIGSIRSYSQSKAITGSWLWQDSKTSISLFIKEDGTIEKHIGPVNEPVLGKNLKHGTYRLQDNQKLIIAWADKDTEADKVKLIDNVTLQIQLKDIKTNALKTYIFKKVVDEEIIEN
jgi:hypothetical protein